VLPRIRPVTWRRSSSTMGASLATGAKSKNIWASRMAAALRRRAHISVCARNWARVLRQSGLMAMTPPRQRGNQIDGCFPFAGEFKHGGAIIALTGTGRNADTNLQC